jgi:lysine 2,3-aminomutase
MSTKRIIEILEALNDIDHIKIIRFGTKMLGFDPLKISTDTDLLDALRHYSKEKQIYFIVHFNHTRELTSEARSTIKLVRQTGVTMVNQTPIIKGVNDNAEELSNLFSQLSYCGILPYYVFGCRPTAGNYTYAVPVETAFKLFTKARSGNSGLAKTARFIMSYEKGKIEVLATFEDKVIMKKHNWADPEENEQIVIHDSNAAAYWYDDYLQVLAENE